MAKLAARDLMTAPVVTTTPETSLGEAARLMLDKDISRLPVLDAQGDLVGIISHSDFTPRERHLPFSEESFYFVLGEWISKANLEEEFSGLASKQVQEVMSHPVVTLDADAPLGMVTQTMFEQHVRRLPIVSGKRLVGIVTRHDLVKLVAGIVAKNASDKS